MIIHSKPMNVRSNDTHKKTNVFYENSVALINPLDELDKLITIVDLTKWIIESNTTSVSVDNKAHRNIHSFQRDHRNNKLFPKAVIKHLLANASLFAEEIAREFPFHQFSPCFDLFKKAKEKLTDKINILADGSFCNGNESDEIVNELFDYIKTESGSEKFQTAVKIYDDSLAMDQQSLMVYVDKLLAQNPKLETAEYLLSYHNNERTYDEDIAYYQYFFSEINRQDFFEQLESDERFNSLTGYIWKFGYCLSKGFYYRILFFFDGSGQAINSANIIDEYWEGKITEGTGRCEHLNVNPSKDTCRHSGALTTISGDTKLRERLENVVKNLIMPDPYVKLYAMDDKRKTFGIREDDPKLREIGISRIEEYFDYRGVFPYIPPSYS